MCEKVEQKVRTTYNEVADELVLEFAVRQPSPTQAPLHASSKQSPSHPLLSSVRTPTPLFARADRARPLAAA